MSKLKLVDWIAGSSPHLNLQNLCLEYTLQLLHFELTGFSEMYSTRLKNPQKTLRNSFPIRRLSKTMCPPKSGESQTAARNHIEESR